MTLPTDFDDLMRQKEAKFGVSLDPEFQADRSGHFRAPSRHLVPVKRCTMTGGRHIVPGASLEPPSADFWPRWPTWGQYQAIAAVLASFEPTWKARGWP